MLMLMKWRNGVQVTVYMEAMVADLEALAHPAAEALTEKVTKGRLDRVRQVKNRLVRLTTRVETFQELLQKLMEDDDDMRDMNLTAKCVLVCRLRACWV
jgi:hypothetical protein